MVLTTLGIGYVVLSVFVWQLADDTQTATPWWPAAGLTVGVLCLVRRGDWPVVLAVIFAADIAADLINGSALPPSLGWAAANTIEPVIGALALGWAFAGRMPNIESPGNVLRIFVVAALAPVAASLVGALTSVAAFDVPLLSTWRTWYVGDVLGILVVLPVVLYASQIRTALTRSFVLVLVGVAAACALIFAVDEVPFYLATPMLVLIAMWLGAPGATSASFVMAIVAYLVSAIGGGPFSVGTGQVDPLTALQAFIAIQLLTAFFVVGLRAELLSARARVDVLSEEQLRDPLTGTGNRRRVEDALAQATSDAAAGSLAVLFLDLDAFKPVNDRYGHGIGDVVLKAVASRLEDAVREADTVGRVGGDEFVVVCRDITQAELAQLATRLRERIAAPISVDGGAVTITASVGTSWAPDAHVSPAELLRRADLAMYGGKVSDRAG